MENINNSEKEDIDNVLGKRSLCSPLLPSTCVVSEAEKVLLTYLDQPCKEKRKPVVNVRTGEKEKEDTENNERVTIFEAKVTLEILSLERVLLNLQGRHKNHVRHGQNQVIVIFLICLSSC